MTASMKTNSTSRSAVFGPRVSIGFVLCSVGVLLAIAGLTRSATNSVGNPLLVNAKSPIGAETQQSGSNIALSPEASAYANTKLTYKIIQAPKHTYCYDVFADGRLMIHQTSAPALPGNEGSRTKEDATKVVLLVIDKIGKGEMPPTISVDEMKKLNVIK
jgi:Domain of unknown function (DUF4907)